MNDTLDFSDFDTQWTPNYIMLYFMYDRFAVSGPALFPFCELMPTRV